jgi:hypothetical protein
MPIIRVGQPFPGHIQEEGLFTFMEVSHGDDQGLDLMFVNSLPRVLPNEVDLLISKPIKVGIVRYHPIIFFLLVVEGPMMLDSPFGIGLYPEGTAVKLLEAARQARGWPAAARRVIDVVVVDSETTLVNRIRRTTLSRAWWMTLADELELCPPSLSREDYTAAMQQAYSRWKAPAEMVSHCLILEETGI